MTVSVFSAIDVSSGKEVQIKIEDQGLVAKGGWATVHRGRILPDGEVIAIKRVKETKQYKVSVPGCKADSSIERWRFFGR